MTAQAIDTVQRPASRRAATHDILGSWRSLAIAAYTRAEYSRTPALRDELIARVAALTGYLLAPEQISVDATAGSASAVVDGLRFRLQNNTLVALRPCAECGLGTYASPAIASPADLGYALAGWQPRGACCTADEDEDWALW